MSETKSHPRILIVGQNWIGDVLFATPAIRALRKKFPKSYLACLIPKRCHAVLKNNPYLQEIIFCPEKAAYWSPAYWQAVGRLRKLKFDRAVFFHRSKTKRSMARLAGIAEIAPYRPPTAAGHKIDHFLELLKPWEVLPDGRFLDFFPDAEDLQEAEALLTSAGCSLQAPYLLVHPGGNWDLKRWPAQSFIEFLSLFCQQFDWRIFLCGTQGESALCQAIASGVPGGRVISLCGRTSLGALAVLQKQARFFISNDSGPIHLAASQRANIVGLFGPTDPALTGPVSEGSVQILKKDVGCQVPCYFKACHDHACMNSLTPNEVLDAIKRS